MVDKTVGNKHMKHLIIIFFLTLSSSCFSQIKSEFLVGTWKFENTTDYQDSIIESSVKEYDFIVYSNGDFEMNSAEFSISGKWKLSKSTLTLIGKRSDREETKIEKLIIHSLDDDKLSIELALENAPKALMNLNRIKK